MKKKLIFVIVFLIVIYGLIMLFMFGKDKDDDSFDNFVIFNNLDLVHEKHGFSKTDYVSMFKNYKGKFLTYSNAKYLGEYTIEYGDVWNIFDDNGNFINYDGTFFAVVPKLKNNVVSIKNSAMTEEDRNYLLNTYNINNFDYLTSSGVYSFDINNKNYKLFILNNLDEDYDNKKNYNLILLKCDGKYNRIIFNKNNNIEMYGIIGVVEFNKERDVYIGIHETNNYYSDNESESDVVYKLENDKLKKVISN